MEERHTHEERDEARRQNRERRLRRHRLWRSVRPALVGLVSIGICIGVLWGGIKLVLEEFIYPVDVNDATPVVVTIVPGSGASTIAKVCTKPAAKGRGLDPLQSRF